MKISILVCAMGWASSFVLWWGWLMGVIEVNVLSICALVFFVLAGGLGGIMAGDRPHDAGKRREG